MNCWDRREPPPRPPLAWRIERAAWRAGPWLLLVAIAAMVAWIF